MAEVLTIFKGETFTLELVCQDADSVAVDLTGCVALAHIREAGRMPRVADLQPTITDAAAGKIRIERTPEQTNPLSEGNFQWDLQLEFPDGRRVNVVPTEPILVRYRMTQPSFLV